MSKIITILTVLMVCVLFGACGGGGDNGDELDCKGDTVCEGCAEDPRPPWCYAEAAETADDPDMCENITDYWPTAESVVSQCIYEIAVARHDCSLCSRITNSQIHTICTQDCVP